MTEPGCAIAGLGREERSDFSSGSEPLDRYSRTQVTQDIRRRRLGSVLLANATIWAAGSGIAVVAMVVDAKDAHAQGIYRHHGSVA